MAANPLGAEIARGYGLEIGFGSWLVASSVPTLAAMALLPLVLYKVIAPEVTATPEAPRAARRALAELGPLRAHEKIVAATFVGMVGPLGRGGDPRPRLDGGRVPRPRRPARDRRADARRHREGRRRARDLHLVRGALHAQRPAQRAGLHGLPGRAAGRGARGPVGGRRRRRARRRLRAAALPVREPDGAPARALRRVPRRGREARRPGGAARVPAALRDATSSRPTRRRGRARTCCSRGAATCRRASSTGWARSPRPSTSCCTSSSGPPG